MSSFPVRRAQRQNLPTTTTSTKEQPQELTAEWYRSCQPEDSERRWAMFSNANNTNAASPSLGNNALLGLSTGGSSTSSVGGGSTTPSTVLSPQRHTTATTLQQLLVSTPPQVRLVSQPSSEPRPSSTSRPSVLFAQLPGEAGEGGPGGVATSTPILDDPMAGQPEDEGAPPLPFEFDSGDEDDDLTTGERGMSEERPSTMQGGGGGYPRAPRAIGLEDEEETASLLPVPVTKQLTLHAHRSQQEQFLQQLGTGHGITLPPPPPSAQTPGNTPYSPTPTSNGSSSGQSGSSSRRANRQASNGRTLEALMNHLQYTDLLTPTYRDKAHTQSELGVVVEVDEAKISQNNLLFLPSASPSVVAAGAMLHHSPSYGKKPCREFFGRGKGTCRHGDKCLFLHQMPSEESGKKDE